jgi:hypothetical protein
MALLFAEIRLQMLDLLLLLESILFAYQQFAVRLPGS